MPLSLKLACIHTIFLHFPSYTPHLVRLPLELRYLIFSSFISWKVISSHHLLYLSNTLHGVYDFTSCWNINDKGIENLIKNFGGNNIAELHLKGTTITSLGVVFISENCKNLRVLNLYGLAFKKDDHLRSLRRCARLEKLNLKKCTGEIKERTLCEIISSCGCLSDLSLSLLFPNLQNVIQAIADHIGPRLLSLKLRFIKGVVFSHSQLELIKTRCTNLKSLDIVGVNTDLRNWDVLGGPSLESLNISHIIVSNPTALDRFSDTLHGLKSLSAKGNGIFNGRCLREIFAMCPLLENISLKARVDIAPQNLELAFVNHPLRNLKQLCLSGCKDINDETFSHIVSSFPPDFEQPLTNLDLSGMWHLQKSLGEAAAKFVHLQTLDLSMCKSLTTEILIKIAENCHVLESIELYMFPMNGDEGITALTRHCPFLQRIGLYGLKRLTDESTILIGKKFPFLKHLDVSATNISDATLVSVSTGCPLLESVFTNNCEFISDRGIIALLKGCKLIQRLSINGCKLLTGDCAEVMASQSKALNYLSMLHCFKIATSGIIMIVRECKNLKVLKLSPDHAISQNDLKNLKAMAPNLVVFL
eukprot:TRINITY_DN726_c0_g2_i1.p1 TRINITY_DN726_c0_g2~~TRINITY_DN726_c0_g2_i1.p1  ORF type:complete len:589 (-),score=62.82 TRINITY_DN726_c0_g2_i1:43-1809(-)